MHLAVRSAVALALCSHAALAATTTATDTTTATTAATSVATERPKLALGVPVLALAAAVAGGSLLVAVCAGALTLQVGRRTLDEKARGGAREAADAKGGDSKASAQEVEARSAGEEMFAV